MITVAEAPVVDIIEEKLEMTVRRLKHPQLCFVCEGVLFIMSVRTLVRAYGESKSHFSTGDVTS
jgi:hypothetical protein